jgi:hypothetical protein
MGLMQIGQAHGSNARTLIVRLRAASAWGPSLSPGGPVARADARSDYLTLPLSSGWSGNAASPWRQTAIAWSCLPCWS